ncbi:multidrug and toxin extrusion protein 1-like isoform X2 [Oreochromis aureus]|uniref:multidrug and toxin extrusion protein 1-like isoform X2 n=1 Tax=Oreochromis aureus TaxID=47969 RepID=UPI001952CAF9|nr:multidrug and toxin extrusion protein 1-like isoform X2 [Oreochromis aureus]
MEDLVSESTCRGVIGQSKTDELPPPAALSVDSSCRSCLKSIKRWVPLDYKHEMVQLLKLAGPVTYGSGNLKRVGVILQRGVLILLLACFPCWALLINTQSILLAVRQSTEVARLSQLYVKIFMPALPAAFMYHLQGSYLQNQGIMWPQVISGAMGNVLNAVINYILLSVLDLGIAGSAAANAISQYSLAVFLFLYIYVKELHIPTWDGWSGDCLQEWGSFFHLALPSMLMQCLEWWLYEIAGFLAGVISETELAAQSVVYEVAVVVFMFPAGFSAAASVRVGKALGGGNTDQAKLSSKVSLLCALIVSCFLGAFLGIAKDVIGYIFTTERDIIQRVANIMKLYSFIHVAEAISSVTGSIVRGAGKQKIGALCSLVGYYLIGFPIGVSLMFPVKMGILGLWTGFLISASLQSMFFIVFLCKLNWTKATEEALVRTGVHITERNTNASLSALDPREKCMRTSRSSSLTPVEERPEPLSSDQKPLGAVALSTRQLVLRRGATVLLMFVILAAGVIISEVLIRLLEK